jgi:hypothetical protein
MKIELRPEISAFGKRIAEKIGDIKRGHTLQEEVKIKRIICDPSSISAEDMEVYREKLRYNVLRRLIIAPNSSWGTLAFSESPILQKEMEKIDNLTPNQLAIEILEEVRRKIKKWGLNSNA